MFSFNKKRLYIFTALSFGSGILSAILVKSDTGMHKLINSLFIGGLISFIPGLFFYVKKLGMFDLFIYGFGLLRRYSKNFEDERHKKPEKYYVFKMEKSVLSHHKEPLFIGAVFLILSISLTIATTNF